MCNQGRELKVGDGECPRGVLARHERALHGAREELPPYNRRRVCAEPHAAHSLLAGITRPYERRSGRHELAQPGGSRVQRIGNGTKVRGHVPYLWRDTDPMLVGVAQGMLEDGEKASGAG